MRASAFTAQFNWRVTAGAVRLYTLARILPA
jgi:hypothetical protein